MSIALQANFPAGRTLVAVGSHLPCPATGGVTGEATYHMHVAGGQVTLVISLQANFSATVVM